MSGTSADGVDVAIVDLAGWRVRVLAFKTFPYPPGIRRAVLAACRPETARLDDICRLNFVLGEVFASAVVRLAREAGIPLASIDLIGSHGQTFYHIPHIPHMPQMPAGRRFGPRSLRSLRSTLQLAEPSVIAERTGITTVADFRPRDIAAGGQGAPLVPFADRVLFQHPRLRRAVQNIGGIANVTYLPPGRGDWLGRVFEAVPVPGAPDGTGSAESSRPCLSPAPTGKLRAPRILAFDTGPGNMVIDRLVMRMTAGRRAFDRDGRLAARGTVVPQLLDDLMRHPFLRRRPPKSTGREEFGWDFTDALWRRARRAHLAAADILATATAFTAASIAGAYARFLPEAPDQVILCGGGSRNGTLVRMIRERLTAAEVLTTDDLGIDADAKEAVSFALLAAATIRGVPGNVPAATGAHHPAILGKIIPGKPSVGSQQ